MKLLVSSLHLYHNIQTYLYSIWMGLRLWPSDMQVARTSYCDEDRPLWQNGRITLSSY